MRLRLSRRNIFFAVASLVIVLYAEWYYPAKAISQCKWPLGPTASHVAMIADPQLVDRHMYSNRGWLLLAITELVSDRFMARNFRLIHRKLRPDFIFFVGDLFDGGREWGDAEWFAEYNRWQRVFPLSRSVPHYQNVPGNHDVGSDNDIIPSAQARFTKYFGKANQIIKVAGHSIVTLDTNVLMNDNPEMKAETEKFLNDIAEKRDHYDPIIVLTHVPLYRPQGSYCGFERETKPFQWIKGQQYITEVHPGITTEVLTKLKPEFVFSGDDHDACKYTHKYTSEDSVEEHTIKSFSLATGIKRPGFQLVSLDTHKRHETDLCLVGDPFWPMIFQGIAYTALVLLMGLVNIAGRVSQRGYRQLPRPAGVEKSSDLWPSGRPYREFAQSLFFSFVAWVFGQLIVHMWSYGRV